MKKLPHDLWVIFFAIKNLPAASKWSPKKSVCLDRKKKHEGTVLFRGGTRTSKDGEIENACKWRLWKLKLCFSRWTDCDVALSEYDNRRNTRPTSFILQQFSDWRLYIASGIDVTFDVLKTQTKSFRFTNTLSAFVRMSSPCFVQFPCLFPTVLKVSIWLVTLGAAIPDNSLMHVVKCWRRLIQEAAFTRQTFLWSKQEDVTIIVKWAASVKLKTELTRTAWITTRDNFSDGKQKNQRQSNGRWFTREEDFKRFGATCFDKEHWWQDCFGESNKTTRQRKDSKGIGLLTTETEASTPEVWISDERAIREGFSRNIKRARWHSGLAKGDWKTCHVAV